MTKGYKYLRIDDEDFPLWYSNLEVAKLISVSISETRIERVPIVWKTRPDILGILKLCEDFKLQAFVCGINSRDSKMVGWDTGQNG